jgi:hypothetical protein
MIENRLAMIFGLFLIGSTARADTAGEIEHLLRFIAASDCTFIRNDVEYDGPAARAHIEKKYDYAKRWVDSAEKFISYAASESSVTRRLYRVRCEGQEQSSSGWLHSELERFRAAQDRSGATGGVGAARD